MTSTPAVDGQGLCGYAQGMSLIATAHRRLYLLLPGLLLAAWLPATAIAEEEEEAPPLLVLQYLSGGKPLLDVPVPYRPGYALSPARGRPAERWRIEPGQPLTSAQRPADRAVHLYQATGTGASTLLAIVHVRYYPDAEGHWTPHFQLLEEPLVRYQDGRWQPYATSRGGTPLWLVLTGTSLPNAEGFYPTLEFGFSAGPLTLDAWLVR